jgi:hypothetical protein
MPQFNDLIDGEYLVRHTHTITLWPERWGGLNLPLGLTWTVVPFTTESVAAVSAEPGVYAFIIRPQTPLTLDTSYLMYIGMTDRPLVQRYRDYLRERDSDQIRPKLLRILPLYGPHLFFAFAPTPDGSTPEAVEQSLLSAFIPPGNDRIDAHVNRIRKAFQ